MKDWIIKDDISIVDSIITESSEFLVDVDIKVIKEFKKSINIVRAEVEAAD